MNINDLIHRLQNHEAEYIAEQSSLDDAVKEKVLSALAQIADPKSIPTSVYELGYAEGSVEFDFGTFTARAYDHHEKAQVKVLAVQFAPGLIIRKGTGTISLVIQAIRNKLNLDTTYNGAHSLKVEEVGEKLYVTIETKVA